MLWGLAFLLLGIAETSCTPRDPAGCLSWLAARGNVKAVEPAEAALVGKWSEGPGLAGSELYLFRDRTYLHTQWSDIGAEKIYDKGRWTFLGGVLALSPDSDITWATRNDRCYLALRQGEDRTDLLLGLERAFAYVSYMAAESPKETPKHVRLASRKRALTWKASESESIKAGLMKRYWRPEAHGK